MRLQQLNLDYDASEDRLLLRVGTNDGAELRMWMTRRFVKVLWPMLVRMAEETSPRIRSQSNPDARKALLGLEHEQAVSRANFSTPFQGGKRSTPLGEQPILLVRVRAGEDDKGRSVLGMHPAKGKGVTLTLDAVLLHSVCKLLQAAVKRSDWELDLSLPGTDTSRPGEAAARTIN